MLLAIQVVSDYYIGWYRYRTFSPLQKVLLDSAVLEAGVILAKTEKQKALKEKDKKETTGKV